MHNADFPAFIRFLPEAVRLREEGIAYCRFLLRQIAKKLLHTVLNAPVVS